MSFFLKPMKIYIVLENCSSLTKLPDLLDEIKFKGRFENSEYLFELEDNIFIEGEVFEFNEGVCESFSRFSSNEKGRSELIVFSFESEKIEYRKWGKTGKLLSNKLKYDYEFTKKEKAKKMKTKFLFSWFDVSDKEAKEEKTGLKKYDYLNRVEDEALWLRDAFTITNIEIDV